MAPFDEQDETFYKPREIGDIESLKSCYTDPEYADLLEKFKKCTAEEYQDFAHFYGWYHGIKMCTSREEFDERMREQHACYLVEDGEVKESYFFSNPDAKYDYFCVIGKDPFARFNSAKFRMKDGSEAQYGLLKDLDIDGTIKDAENEYRDEYRQVIKEYGEMKHTPWSEFLKRVENKEITIDEARAEYQLQGSVKKYMDEHPFGDPDKFTCTEDEYAANATLPFFSANIMGEWYEKGNMGWFAMVSDEKEKSEWKRLIEAALRKAQEDYPEEQFHILDCHI